MIEMRNRILKERRSRFWFLEYTPYFSISPTVNYLAFFVKGHSNGLESAVTSELWKITQNTPALNYNQPRSIDHYLEVSAE